MNIDNLLQYKTGDFNYVGERLKEIRLELQEKDMEENNITVGESQFSREAIGDRLGVNYSTMANVERAGIHTNSVKLINLYYTLGYNPSWILIEDNEFINKKVIQENFMFKSSIQENFLKMENVIKDSLKEFKSSI